MKRKGTPAEGAGFQQSAARLTPLDIQEKTFRTARLSGGYQVREVDEFLDQVTDALSALIAENERLRAAATGGPSAPSAATQAPAVPSTSVVGAEDRAAVESFLQRERSFLQSLGGLVQEHAEVLREMARSARRHGPSQEVGPRVEPSATSEVVEETEATPASAAQEPAAVDEPVVAASPTEVEPEAPIEVGDDVSPSAQEPPPDEEPPDEGPIRLEETHTVRSRTEGDPEPSLRELFWGED